MDGIFGLEICEVVKEFQCLLLNLVDDDGIIGYDMMQKLDQVVVIGIKVWFEGDVKMKWLVIGVLVGYELF